MDIIEGNAKPREDCAAISMRLTGTPPARRDTFIIAKLCILRTAFLPPKAGRVNAGLGNAYANDCVATLLSLFEHYCQAGGGALSSWGGRDRGEAKPREPCSERMTSKKSPAPICIHRFIWHLLPQYLTNRYINRISQVKSIRRLFCCGEDID